MLNRKKSRNISVDGKMYNWIITVDSSELVLICVREDNKGSRLIANLDIETHKFWVEFPYTDHLNLNVLSSRDIRKIIIDGINLGWEPERKGPLFKVKYSKEKNLLALS